MGPRNDPFLAPTTHAAAAVSLRHAHCQRGGTNPFRGHMHLTQDALRSQNFALNSGCTGTAITELCCMDGFRGDAQESWAATENNQSFCKI